MPRWPRLRAILRRPCAPLIGASSSGVMSVRLRISEIFACVQGEGVTIGTASAVVRLQGCSVGCSWCDTKYSWASTGGREMTLDAVLAEVASTGLENVVVTGGEPLEHPGFVDVVDALKGAGRRIEVETAGTQLPPSAAADQRHVSPQLRPPGGAANGRLPAAPRAAFPGRKARRKLFRAAGRGVGAVPGS